MINLTDEISALCLKALGKLPLSIVYRLGELLGKFFASMPTDARRVTAINIDLCFPNETAKFRHDLVQKSIVETVITGFEMGPIWTGKVDDILARVISVEGEQQVRSALESGKGVILLAPHLGNWEVIGYYLSTYFDFTVMYQPGDLPKVSEIVLSARRQLKATLVPTDKTGVMALFKKLKKGKPIGILPDQKPDRASGVMAPFFGVPALTQTLGPKLAQQAKAEVFGAVCLRDRAAGGYRLHFLPVEADVHNEDMAIACAAMNRSIEAWVRMCPEQYQWEYKRFGRRPAPLPDVYKKQRSD